MNAADVVGYAYDADVHCVECAEKQFPVLGTDVDVDPEDPALEDSEGNPAHPIFAGADAYGQCSDCDKGMCIRCPCGSAHECPTCEGTGRVSLVCAECGDELVS